MAQAFQLVPRVDIIEAEVVAQRNKIKEILQRIDRIDLDLMQEFCMKLHDDFVADPPVTKSHFKEKLDNLATKEDLNIVSKELG